MSVLIYKLKLTCGKMGCYVVYLIFKTPLTQSSWLVPLSDLVGLYKTHTMCCCWAKHHAALPQGLTSCQMRDADISVSPFFFSFFMNMWNSLNVFSRCRCSSVSGLDGKYQRAKRKSCSRSCGANYDWTVALWRRYGFVIWTHRCIVPAVSTGCEELREDSLHH